MAGDPNLRSDGPGRPNIQHPTPDAGGFPSLDTGRLRFDNGLWFDAEGDGQFAQVLEAIALSGAFVEHEDGRVYRLDPATPFVVEETGTQKIVLRREGWYVEDATPTHSHTHTPTHSHTHTPTHSHTHTPTHSHTHTPTHSHTHTPTHPHTHTHSLSPPPPDTFCRYITRYVIHRGSPLVRVFHTWVFTGDGNRDRIRNMGWRLDLAGQGRNEAFLTAFDAAGDWTRGESLLQYDYEHFNIAAGDGVTPYPGGRAPGVARVDLDGARLYFGAKDFWQNYPSELEFRDGAFWFHNWPRNNKPARHTFDKELIVEQGDPAASSSAARYALEAPDKLTRSEWVLNVIQSRHAHEGQVLDFRLPAVYNDDPIWTAINSGASYWERGDVETLNAQGMARTEEFWLLFVDEETAADDARPLLQGLNDETLRAVVDPAWVAASGALYEIHPRDTERFPREEAVYEEVALSPGRVAERLGIYGMWIYGDLPSWSPRLETKDPELYRAFARQHLGWPYPWTPFARSGDSRFFKWAEASTRNVLDVGWCHYADAEVDRRVGPDRHRRKGILLPGPIPWDNGSGNVPVTRSLLTRVDYLLDAWYLTGYRRAMDQVRTWMDLARVQEDLDSRGAAHWFGRQSNAPLKAYVEAWEATFDPWFLVAAHGLSQGHLHGRTSEHADGRYGGRQWDTGDREFLRFTGDPEFRDFYLNRHAARAVSERVWSNWNRRRPIIPAKVFAWQLTGDEYYLRRTAYDVENTVHLAGDWNPYAHRMRTQPRAEWVQGVWEGNSFGRHYRFFTATHLRWFPHALWALAQADERPAPIYTTYNALLPDRAPAEPRQRLTLAIAKGPDRPLTVYLSLGTDRHLGALPSAPEGFAMEYTLSLPDGSPRFEGVWTHRETLEVEASAPAGVCRLALHTDRGAGHVFGLPATEVGTPEVILPGPGEATPCVGWRSLWFRVPEGVERFSVLASGPSATILDPDGQVAWRAADTDADAERLVSVRPEQTGRLWRVNVPGHFRLDASIPAVYAVEPDRWFMP